MSLNNVTIMGRLTRDPELRYTISNTAVLSFTVAVDRDYVKPGEERQTDFIDVVAWGETAEFIDRYFEKGQKIIVEGSIQTRIYTDKDDNKHKDVEVVARQVHFAESKKHGKKPGSLDEGIPEGYAEVKDLDVPF